jgi:hypothetical protein
VGRGAAEVRTRVFPASVRRERVRRAIVTLSVAIRAEMGTGEAVPEDPALTMRDRPVTP